MKQGTEIVGKHDAREEVPAPQVDHLYRIAFEASVMILVVATVRTCHAASPLIDPPQRIPKAYGVLLLTAGSAAHLHD
jgi:hypothetical protein